MNMDMIEQYLKKDEIDNLFFKAKQKVDQILTKEDYLHLELNIETNEKLTFENSSIAVVLYHKLILTPSIKICINFIKSNKKIGYYTLYLDLNRNFLDEYFIIY
jgi:hypothetical protein